jgi:nucleoside 2-deoxyribosyltransferase
LNGHRALLISTPIVFQLGRIMRIYMAGPLGFSEAGLRFHTDVLLKLVRRLGHEPLDPWALTDPAKLDAIRAMTWGKRRRDAWTRLDMEIGAINRRAIDRSDIVLAVLDGADVDSGTAAEIGYAFALGKPIIGYRGDWRICSDNEGSIVNLQVEYFVRESGGTIVTRAQDIERAIRQIQRRDR